LRRAAFAVVAFACVSWLAACGTASAHGVLERSTPAAGTTLAVAPVHVDLWFTEPIDPALSVVRVLDATGTRVSGLSTPSVDGRRVTVAVGRLPVGSYTVRWRVLSTVDGHSTGGAFVFGVGDAERTPQNRAPGAFTADWPPLAVVLSRWVALVAGLVAVASTWFHRLVIGPAVRRADLADATVIDDAARRVMSMLRVGAAASLLVVTPIEAIARAYHLLDVPLRNVFAGGGVWTFLLGTRPGWSLLARWWLALLLVLPATPRGTILQATGLGWFVIVTGVTAGFGGPAILAGSAHLSILVLVAAVYGMITLLATMIFPLIPDGRVRPLPAIQMAVAILILAIGTLTAHAWAAGPIAVLADFIHAAAAGVWVGGSLCVFALMWWAPVDGRAVVVQTLAPRVATVAAWSVVALFATGFFATILHVPNVRSLWSTGYGLGLLIKMLLFVSMLAIGGWLWLRTRTEARALASRVPAVPAPGLSRVLLADVALGALAVLAAAAITLVPPARVAVQSRDEGPPSQGAASGNAAPRRAELLLGAESLDLNVRLEVRPARPGMNRFSVRVMTAGDLRLDDTARVLVRLTNLDEDLAPVTFTLGRTQTAAYEAQNGDLAVSGFWQADLVVRRRGRADATFTLPMQIGTRPDRGTDPAALALLVDAERAFDKVASWRQEQQVTDTTGGTVSVHAEFVRPDRLRTRTRSSEMIIVGRSQVRRSADGTVQRAVLPTALKVAFPYLAASAARNAVLGREVVCALERCRVVLWESAGRAASFAALVSTRTKLLHHLFMITPSRHTTIRIYDINRPVRIDLP
jgi:copper transport protein